MVNSAGQLRNYIPIGAPARREAADGTEDSMRVSMGFEPAWYTKRCEVDFSEKFHKDPYCRFRNIEVMKRELVKAFPEVSCWDTTNIQDQATISGSYGAYPVPHAMGVPLIFHSERGPVLNPAGRLSVKEIEQLSVDTILNGPVVEDILNQMDIIENEWGTIHGYLNWQGVLNNGFNIRGQDVFLDMSDNPRFAHQFFSLITDVMIGLAEIVQEKQRGSGFQVDQFSVSNCVMNMISPDMYEEFILPHDTRLAESFDRFGVHTCEWDITPYIDVLKKLPKMGYLDMGITSDLKRASDMFPNARKAVLYSPVKLENVDIDIIQKDMDMIFRDLSPCDVVLAEIQHNTPDRKVSDVLRICRERSEKYE